MMIKLYYSPGSPFVRKVLVFIKEIGIEDQVEYIEPDFRGADPALLTVNPLSKIPTIELEDGSFFFDSPTVCEYLDTLHDGPKWFPEKGTDEYWRATRLRVLADGIIEANTLVGLRRREPAEKQSEAWEQKFRPKIVRGLAFLEKLPEWLAEPLNIGHIATAATLDHLLRVSSDIIWHGDTHPNLTAFYDAFAARPSMVETRPPAPKPKA